jgi:deoxyribonuclease V
MTRGTILAVDVDYRANGAFAAGVLFDDWSASTALREVTLPVPSVAEYEPGQFYRRELPCVLALLDALDQSTATSSPAIVVVDGYVRLGADRRPGLGQHLFDALAGRVAVVGVAKSRFRDTPPDTEVLRGRSLRPLFVTAAGMSVDDAKTAVLSMAGRHRVPTMLRRVDQLSRAP